jgi:SAM-dependent methyltransferase
MPDTPAWYPDETALSGIDCVTNDDVRAYAVRQGFDPSRELAILHDLGLDDTETLVEFGPGPGGVVLAAAALARRVVAVDPAPALVSFLAHEVATRGLTNVDVVHAGFLTYQHEGEPAGFVFSKNALHQLPDFWKVEALQRVATILRPGGVLRLRDLVWSFAPEDATERLEAWFAHANQRQQGWSRAGLEAHVREEFSTYTWLLEAMLERTGFVIEERTCSDSGVYADYTCRRR